ncbi:MAG: alpha/beta hydrolase [Rhizobiaceae bacterium]
MNKSPPAAMSPEAEAFLETGDMATNSSIMETSMEDIRKAALEVYRPACEQAVRKHGVATKDLEIAGIQCMEINPPNPVTARQILHLFGGGFVQGSPFEELPITASLAADTGATVICPYYRLAPEHPFPAALDDISLVADELLTENTGTLLTGESAGGNLALSLVHRLRKQGKPVPKAIALFSPAVDLSHHGDSAKADRDPFLLASRIPEARKAYIPELNPVNPEISPIYGPFDTEFPPTLITTGTRDLLLSGCTRLARVMREAGAHVDLRVWEGMWHVFEFYPDIPEAEASLSEVAEFLNRYF